jgi:hypothetical protein
MASLLVLESYLLFPLAFIRSVPWGFSIISSRQWFLLRRQSRECTGCCYRQLVGSGGSSFNPSTLMLTCVCWSGFESNVTVNTIFFPISAPKLGGVRWGLRFCSCLTQSTGHQQFAQHAFQWAWVVHLLYYQQLQERGGTYRKQEMTM